MAPSKPSTRISFSLAKGKIIGLLGPNGAGKTTTIQMLVGITLPDGGAIRYFGLDLHTHREACLQRINFSSSYNMLQSRITVWENLIVFARLYRVDNPKARSGELGEYFGITQLMDQRFMTLSAGQKTRVNLVKALLNDPEVILMDEPTASLDPDIADRTLSLIESLREAARPGHRLHQPPDGRGRPASATRSSSWTTAASSPRTRPPD